jgi:hypothetical protein
MSDQEKKPTTRFGSVQNQWDTIGSEKPKTPEKEKPVSKAKTPEVEQPEKSVIYTRERDNRVMRRKTNAIPQDLWDRLEILAIRKHERPSNLLARIIEEYLDREE